MAGKANGQGTDLSPENILFKLAVIGDIHRRYTDLDTQYFLDSDYDRILYLGDLPGRSQTGSCEIAQRIAPLGRRALFIAGNHDGTNIPQLLGEIKNKPAVVEKFSRNMSKRVQRIIDTLGDVPFCGYSLHSLGEDIDFIAGRPHSIGGPSIAFASYMKETYGITDMQHSAERIIEAVESSQASHLIFFGHNGPSGLGWDRSDIWGCDFRKQMGDFGDPDLELAIKHARQIGKKVSCVIAGHMHHRLKGSGYRKWLVEKDETLYINAARVPRIFRKDSHWYHHYVRILIDRNMSAHATEVLLPMESEAETTDLKEQLNTDGSG